MSASDVSFVDIEHDGRTARLEYAWIEPAAVQLASADRPLVVFLHEGLGSLALW